MTLSVKNKELAKDILDIIGGNENVVKASHCATSRTYCVTNDNLELTIVFNHSYNAI
jgi:phosphotransferase system IIB component